MLKLEEYKLFLLGIHPISKVVIKEYVPFHKANLFASLEGSRKSNFILNEKKITDFMQIVVII